METQKGRSQAARFLIALLAPAVVAGLMQLTWPSFEQSPVSIYLLAVMFSAWYGGIGPGLVSLAVSFLVADYFFIAPYFALWPAKKNDLIRLATLVTVGTFISVLCELMHRARRVVESSLGSTRRAEETLRRSEEQLAGVIGSAMDAIISVDKDQRIILFNAAAERMFLCPSEEAIGGSLDRFIPERFRPSHGEHIQNFSRTHVTKRSMGALGPIFGLRTNGEEFPIEASISQVEVGGEKIFSVILRDVTERNRAEEKFRLAVESAPNAVVISDREGRIVLVNEQTEKLFGYTRAELLTQSVDVLVPERFAKRHPDYRRGFHSDPAVRSMGVGRDLRARRKDGSEFPVEIGLTPIHANEGLLVLSAIVDISERRQAEEKFQLAVESAPNGVVMVNSDGRIVLVNRQTERLFGYERAELMGQPIEILVPERYRSQHPSYRDTFLDHPAVRSMGAGRDLYGLRKDGTEFPVEIGLTPIQTEEGNFVLSAIVDITERKSAEEARKASEARYGTLFECAPDGIVIADRESYYIDANASVCQMLGYTRDELIGLHASDIVVQTEIEHIETALSLIKNSSDYHREWQFRRKDGSVFPADVIATMMPDGNLLGMIRDITERKRTEGRFRRLVDSNAHGVMFWNKKGEIIAANDGFLRIVGYAREDLEAGRIDWTAMTPPEYADLDRISLEEIAEKGVCQPVEKEFFRQDGSRVPVLVGAAAFEDNPDEGVGFVLDISERRRTEQALRESEARFSFLNDLVEATRTLADPSQIMAVMARMLGVHLHASRCAYADVESDGEQFTILDDYTDGCASTVGNYRLSLFGAKAVSKLHNGQTLIIRDMDAELSPDDGADMFNAIGIKAIITCPLVKDGDLRAMMAVHQTTPRDWSSNEIAIVQDVVERCWATIERRTAEERIQELNAELEQRVIDRTAQLETANTDLRHSRAELNSLFESLPGLYLVLTPDLKIISASDAYLKATLTTREGIIGRGLFDIFPDNPDDPGTTAVSNMQASIDRAVQSGAPDIMSIQKHDIRAPDGVFEERYWSPINSPLFGADRQIKYIVHRVEEVTEFVRQKARRSGSDVELSARVQQMEAEVFQSSQRLQAANQQLEAANKELEAFAYSVSHDLRAPLRHINGFSQALLEDYEDRLDETGKGYLREVRGASREMAQLIDDLLQLARVTRSEMSREFVDLSELSHSIVDEITKRESGRKVAVVIEEALSVQGDRRLLRVLLTNLVGNAWKFTSKVDYPEISVGKKQGTDEPVYFVRDNGAGFDMAYVDKLFGAFQRLHTAREFEGTGIGLATVQRIVHRHGGRVWAEGAVNLGATFYFTLSSFKETEDGEQSDITG